jgi:hypothetical protein
MLELWCQRLITIKTTSRTRIDEKAAGAACASWFPATDEILELSQSGLFVFHSCRHLPPFPPMARWQFLL